MTESCFELDLTKDTPTIPDNPSGTAETATPAPTVARSPRKAAKTKRGRKKTEKAAKDRFFADKRQLRVWVRADKFERFKKALESEGLSLYRFINDFIDGYIGADEEEDGENEDEE